MCAGDLGMYRVMPWAYPPISGGSSGGFSPDDSGGGSGSVDSNTVFIENDNSKTATGGSSRNTADSVTISIEYGRYGVGNLNGIKMIKMFVGIDELYFSDDPDYNAVGLISSNPINLRTYNPPFDTLVNSTDSNSVLFNMSVTKATSIKANKYKFYLLFEGVNADGETIRSSKFYGTWGM